MNISFKNIGQAITQTFSAKKPAQPSKRLLPWSARHGYQTQKDIRSWKRAESTALSDRPRTFDLQLLYSDIYKDALLTSQVNNRIQQVLSMPFVLKKGNGEIDEEQTKLLKKEVIYRFLTRAGLEQTYYGYSLVELFYNYDINGKLHLDGKILPRTNTVPTLGEFFKDYTDDYGIKYREMKEFGIWILEYNTSELGLLNKAVPHVLFKRFGHANLSELTEIVGVPPRVMKTNTRDTTSLNRAESMMRDMGSSAYFIVDLLEQFEFAEPTNSKGEVHQNLINICNNELSMLISGAVIGQDTKNGNRSKEEANQDILWYLVQDDMAMMEQNWNTINIPCLQQHGILKGDLTFEYEKAEDITQLWTMTSQIIPYYDIEPTWIKDKFGIEVTAKKQAGATLQLNPSFFLTAPQVGAKACCSAHHTSDIKLSSSLNDELLITRFYKSKGELQFDAPTFSHTAQNLSEAFQKAWKKGNKAKLGLDIGITYGYDDPASLTAYEMNIFRFAGVKTLAEAQALNKAFRESTSFTDFKMKASLITKIHNTEWLLTEYNTASAVGESAATYARLKEQIDIFPYWQYKTVGDAKVRFEHQELDGIVLPANHPLWKTIFPPNGWNCRCYIIALTAKEAARINIDENIAKANAYIKTEEFTKAKKGGWGVNRAETQEVFTENQQYINNMTDANKLLSELSPKDYNIKPPKNKPTFEPNTQSPEAIIKNGIDFTDYNKRKINTTPEAIQNIDDKELLDKISEVLNKPDEVWFKSNKKGETFDEFLYIKEYEGIKIALEAKHTKKDGLTLKRLFKILDDTIRWGLLIK